MKSVSNKAVNMVSRNDKLLASPQMLVDEFTGSKKLFLLLGVLCVILGLILVGSNAITKLLDMPIEAVDVRGELNFVSEKDIQNVMVKYINEGYLEVNLSILKKEIELLPWVFSSRLQRSYYNKLFVDVIEQKPVAIWGNKAYLNNRGEIFSPENFEKINKKLMPEIVGPDDRLKQTWRVYLDLKDSFAKYNLGLRKMVLDEKGGQKIVLNNGIHVIFGSQDIEARLARFFKVYEHYLVTTRENIKSVDLRYTNGIAVTWLEPKNI